MTSATIYHNPRCSKSRATLALLEARGVTIDTVLYLETPPDKQTLTRILAMLELSPREILRTGESAYTDNNLDDPLLTDTDILDAIINAPILLERPIVVCGTRAKIGRPPENVLQIL
jgi:arsenate reductase (glutaredoxin)